MCRHARSSSEGDIASGKSAEGIIDEDQSTMLVQSYDITISIMGEVSE